MECSDEATGLLIRLFQIIRDLKTENHKLTLLLQEADALLNPPLKSPDELIKIAELETEGLELEA